ncbi:MAG TPA: two-component regulator propeller domain-containing protein [Chitinophagaceae bacterium]|nr:two-component regulator propeller domain-containing protein [Chitinophagaceae bacterium]
MKPKSPFYLLLLAALLIDICPAITQEIFFNKVFSLEGKVFSHVSGITQDAQGFMWFATKKGLFKYDGYQMTSYTNNPDDTNSLATNALEAICVDSSGILWIGTLGQGLERFDPATGIFTHFRHDPKDPARLSSDWVHALLVDQEGSLWAGTERGLDRFDAQTGKFINFRNRPNDPTSLSCNAVVAIYEDKQTTLWIGTGSVYGGNDDEGGLNRMDKRPGHLPPTCMILKIHSA